MMPWEFQNILELSKATFSSASSTTPFFPLRDFKLLHRNAFDFLGFLGASSNFYNMKWSGKRRIKNVGMILGIMPNSNARMPSLENLARGHDSSALEDLVKAALGYFESQGEDWTDNQWILSDHQIRDIVSVARKLGLKNASC